MKLGSLLHQGRPTVAGIDSHTGRYWPLSDILPAAPVPATCDMVQAIAFLLDHPISALPSTGGYTLSGVELLAPIPAPPHNIMCVGKNYHAHAKEFSGSGFDAGSKAGDASPEDPIIFTKPSTSVSGPTADIPLWPGLDDAVDYEAELAVVIGRGGRFIARADALSHVFGYTAFNDVTARDLQRIHKQWFLGKGIDGFGPMGPWIVTADEIDGADLRISCRVNGETRQDSTTKDLIFDVPTLIETISRSMTLHSGDIIATGTPEGVGIGFKPPRFLGEGDVVEVEIAGIGTLRNVVRRPTTATVMSTESVSQAAD